MGKSWYELMKLKLLSWNVRGVNDKDKRVAVKVGMSTGHEA